MHNDNPGDRINITYLGDQGHSENTVTVKLARPATGQNAWMMDRETGPMGQDMQGMQNWQMRNRMGSTYGSGEPACDRQQMHQQMQELRDQMEQLSDALPGGSITISGTGGDKSPVRPAAKQELPERPSPPQMETQPGPEGDHFLRRGESPGFRIPRLAEDPSQEQDAFGFRALAQAPPKLGQRHRVVPEKVRHRFRVVEVRCHPDRASRRHVARLARPVMALRASHQQPPARAQLGRTRRRKGPAARAAGPFAEPLSRTAGSAKTR